MAAKKRNKIIQLSTICLYVLSLCSEMFFELADNPAGGVLFIALIVATVVNSEGSAHEAVAVAVG